MWSVSKKTKTKNTDKRRKIGQALETTPSVRLVEGGLAAGWPNDPSASNDPIGVASLAVVGGRLSVDNSASYFGTPHVILSPQTFDSNWVLHKFDSDLIRRMPPTRLMEVLADLSPDVSRALWDFLRLCNPGWTCTVLTEKNGSPDTVGQKMVEDFFEMLTLRYGSVDVVIGRLFMSAFMRGAIMAELVLDLDGRNMVDLATPDPASVRFIRSQDTVLGPIWQLAQWQNRPSPVHQSVAGYVPLLWPTIKYIPIDPFPGVPYGRAMAAPAVFSTLFLLGLLHDLRRVVSQQGYPRLDISVSMERIRNSMPSKVLNDAEQYKTWVKNTITEIETAYSCLEPDDTYVHTDVVAINRPVGAVDASSLGAIDGLIQALERMSTRALKTMPFMMASTQTTTETLANREWEVQSAGIRSIQKYGQTALNHLLMMGLQAQGHPACVCMEFGELRQAQALLDAQAEAIEIMNIYNKWCHGWITMDEAAQAAVGHDAVATEPPVLLAGNTAFELMPSDENPRSDGNKRIKLLDGAV